MMASTSRSNPTERRKRSADQRSLQLCHRERQRLVSFSASADHPPHDDDVGVDRYKARLPIEADSKKRSCFLKGFFQKKKTSKKGTNGSDTVLAGYRELTYKID